MPEVAFASVPAALSCYLLKLLMGRILSSLLALNDLFLKNPIARYLFVFAFVLKQVRKNPDCKKGKFDLQ